MFAFRPFPLTGPVALLALAGAPAAQTADLSWSDGELGNQVSYHLTGDPGELFLLGVSFNAGPTPFSILDPTDPRELSLGLDALGFWVNASFDGTGLLTVVYPFPGTRWRLMRLWSPPIGRRLAMPFGKHLRHMT